MSSPTTNLSAVIVGGGPVGWLSACALNDVGMKTTLIAKDEPFSDLRTVALMQGSLAFMTRLELTPETIADATPLETMRLIDGTQRLIRAPEVNFIASEINQPHFALNIPVQNLVKRIQEKLLSSENFEHITSQATDISLNSCADVKLASGDSISADLVIGADGRGSKVRESAGISVKKWSYPQTAFITQFSHDRSHFNISTEFHTETGPFTLVPLSGNRSSVVCVVEPNEADRLMALDDLALAAELERRSKFIVGKMSDLQDRQMFPMSSQIAEKMALGRAFLVGESGHAFPPIGAQGLNLGMRDVEELAKKLKHVSTDDVENAADAYSKARRIDVGSRTMGVDILNRSLLSDFLPVQSARSIGLQVAKSIAPIRKLMMRQGLGAHSA